MKLNPVHTIRGRLLLGFGLLVLLLVAAGLVGRAALSSTASTVGDVLQDMQVENALSSQLSANISR
jgi:CHASE3 domain sensor protein